MFGQGLKEDLAAVSYTHLSLPFFHNIYLPQTHTFSLNITVFAAKIQFYPHQSYTTNHYNARQYTSHSFSIMADNFSSMADYTHHCHVIPPPPSHGTATRHHVPHQLPSRVTPNYPQCHVTPYLRHRHVTPNYPPFAVAWCRPPGGWVLRLGMTSLLS